MTTVIETWTGSNGAAWPSPWVTSGGAGSVQDIQGNQGRLVAPTTTYTGVRAFYGLAGRLDITLTIDVANPKTENYVLFAYRGDDWASSASSNLNNGYNVELAYNSNTVELYRTTANVRTSLAAPAKTYTAGQPIRLRVQVFDTTHRVRIWNSNVGEPGTWDIDVQDATWSYGQWGLANASGVTVGPMLFDDLAGVVDEAPLLVQQVGNQVSNAAATTTVISFAGTTKPQVGDLVVMYGSRDNDNNDPLTGDSFSDGTANSYTRLVDGSSLVTANAGVVGVMFYCILTVAWAGGTNTLTWTHPSRTAAMRMEQWKGVASLRASASNVSAAGAPSVALAGFLSGDLALAMEAIEYSTAGTSTGDADTTSGSWSAMQGPTATTGTTLAAVKVITQSKAVTSDSTQTYNPTHSVTASVDTVAIIADFVPAPIPRTSRYVYRPANQRAANW